MYRPIAKDMAITINVSFTTSSRVGQVTFASSALTSRKNVTGPPAKSGIIGVGRLAIDWKCTTQRVDL